MSCKLPLLDGTPGASDEVLSALVEVHEAERVVRMCQQTGRELSGIISAAWALLLRCYTGQRQVSFACNDSGDPKQLRIGIDEDETLSQFTQGVSMMRSDGALDAINTGIVVQKDRFDSTFSQNVSAMRHSMSRD